MKKYDTVFIDRDGTLNEDPGYIDSIEKFHFFPFVNDAVAALKKHGNRICIITNQSGVSRGLIQLEELEKINKFIEKTFIDSGVEYLGLYYCTDHPQNATNRRKPGTGMFLEAAHDHGIDISRSIVIGDGLTDMEAGFNLNIDTMLVLTGRGRETQKQLELQKRKPTYITQNLLTGVNYLEE